MIANNKYQEDISMLPAGTELMGSPCTIREITVCLETSGVAIVSFSDSTSTYKYADRIRKVAFSGPNTIQLKFPKGLPCSTGLSAVSSIDSVDVSISYD